VIKESQRSQQISFGAMTLFITRIKERHGSVSGPLHFEPPASQVFEVISSTLVLLLGMNRVSCCQRGKREQSVAHFILDSCCSWPFFRTGRGISSAINACFFLSQILLDIGRRHTSTWSHSIPRTILHLLVYFKNLCRTL
jgi:hypothetical protein